MTQTLTIGDSLYTIDSTYRRGRRAFEEGISYHCNPYRPGSTRHYQWAQGHLHASEGIE